MLAIRMWSVARGRALRLDVRVAGRVHPDLASTLHDGDHPGRAAGHRDEPLQRAIEGGIRLLGGGGGRRSPCTDERRERDD